MSLLKKGAYVLVFKTTQSDVFTYDPSYKISLFLIACLVYKFGTIKSYQDHFVDRKQKKYNTSHLNQIHVMYRKEKKNLLEVMFTYFGYSVCVTFYTK